MTDEIKIEKGVPPPIRYKYPFREMDVGESFFAPVAINRLNSARSYYVSRAGNGSRFLCRTVDGGTRCWRIE